MNIREQIEDRIKGSEDERAASLWRTCKEIIGAVRAHDKRIIAQMSQYDLHDEAHSEKVVEIIESLLGDKIKGLSFYELVLIYMAAYLHDSAMALPEWEYNVLRAVEGTEEIADNTLAFHIGNDMRPVHRFSEALEIVRREKDRLFAYDTAKGYVFAPESEEKMLESLARLICDYEKFRNGYTADLQQRQGSVPGYHDMSKMIRSEYIRRTHPIRAAENVRALQPRFCEALGERYGRYLTADLADICRCHGEELKSLFELEPARKDWMGISANIQFAAMLLRLGDVIHFSADRAPLSLFAEKQITDETSFLHWKAKFQELSYEICHRDDTICIKYMAFCKEPDVYYFIQDYLDWVDKEIEHFYILRNRWNVPACRAAEAYQLPLGPAVDRQEIAYDAEQFRPDADLKFVLDQAKILELLTGVQLYKDPFLCLRELYQNALDASKCMLAYNKKKGIAQGLSIEFGIGKEKVHGIERKYIYCLDHGTGMDLYIIKNCLLHIGHSYYKSRAFAQKNTEWDLGVTPTSQFGIGILSGYMLADKIGVTTICHEEKDQYRSFVMEGISEHFYYTRTSEMEKELLGEHGTIVKLYLKPEFEDRVNAKYFAKMPLALMDSVGEVVERVCDRETLKGDLFYIINRQIGIGTPGIKVYIKDEDGIAREIYQCISIFDPRKYQEIDEEDLETLWKLRIWWDGYEPYKEYIKKRDMIEDYVIKVADDDLEIYSLISLPKKGIGDVDSRLFDITDFIGKRHYQNYVDGVRIDGFSDWAKDILGEDIKHRSIFNYHGVKRPIISVDRNSIIRMPDMDEELGALQERFVMELERILVEHVKKESIDARSVEMLLVFEILTRMFPFTSSKIFYLIKDLGARIRINGLSLQDKSASIQDLFDEERLVIKDTDFSQYPEVIREILLGRMIDADKVSVDGSTLTISGKDHTDFLFSVYAYRNRAVSLSIMAIRADEWKGGYAEYDLVNRLWPVVSSELFDRLQEEEKIVSITPRCKILDGEVRERIERSTERLYDIAALDPVLIHPFYGIGGKKDFRGYGKYGGHVGEFDHIYRDYELYELSDNGKSIDEKKISPVLFVFIAPRKLNEKEEKRLAELEEEDPQYVKGVREGWSVLFLGAIAKYVIVPGMITRQQMVEKIPESYKKLRPDLQFQFVDGTRVF